VDNGRRPPLIRVLTAGEYKPGVVKARIDKVQGAKSEAVAIEKALIEEQAKPPTEQAASGLDNLTALLAQTKSEYPKQVQAFLTQHPKYRRRFVDQQANHPKALAKIADRLPSGSLAVQLFSGPDALYIFVVAPGEHISRRNAASGQR